MQKGKREVLEANYLDARLHLSMQSLEPKEAKGGEGEAPHAAPA